MSAVGLNYSWQIQVYGIIWPFLPAWTEGAGSSITYPVNQLHDVDILPIAFPSLPSPVKLFVWEIKLVCVWPWQDLAGVGVGSRVQPKLSAFAPCCTMRNICRRFGMGVAGCDAQPCVQPWFRDNTAMGEQWHQEGKCTIWHQRAVGSFRAHYSFSTGKPIL